MTDLQSSTPPEATQSFISSIADKNGAVEKTTDCLPRCRAAVLLVLMVVLAVGLDLFFFTGYYASDDLEYFRGAAAVVETGHLQPHPFLEHTRLSVLGWDMLIGVLSHFNVQAIAASYVFWHAALLLCTYLLTRQLFGRRAALIAGYTTATFPLFIIFSTGIFPDLLMAVFFVLALSAFVQTFKLRRSGRIVWPILLMFAAGISVGAAYMAKESGLIALPFFFFVWLCGELKLRRAVPTNGKARDAQQIDSAEHRSSFTLRRPSLLLGLVVGASFAVGFFFMFGIDYKLLNHLTGRHDFFRLTELTSPEVDLSTHKNFQRDGGYSPVERFGAAMDRLGPAFLPNALKYLFLAALIVYPFLPNRNWSLYFFGLWVFAFLTWGTYSFKHYYPPRLQPRYYIPAFPFLIIVCARVVDWVVGLCDRPRRFRRACRYGQRGAIVIIAIAPLLLMDAPNSRAGRLYRADFVRHVSEAVRDATKLGANEIVIGEYAAQRISPIWFKGPPSTPYGLRPKNVVTAAEYRYPLLKKLLAQGGFYYVQGPQYLQSTGVYTPLNTFDDLVFPLVSTQPWVRPRDEKQSKSTDSPMIFTSIEPIDSCCVQIAGYELSQVRVVRYDKTYRSRTAELTHRFANSHVQNNSYFTGTAPFDLYRIDAVPITCRLENEFTYFENEIIKAEVSTRPVALEWRPSDTERAQKKPVETGGNVWVVASSGDKNQAVTFSPVGSKNDTADPIVMPAERRFWITIGIKIKGDIQVAVIFDIYADKECRQRISEKRAVLAEGENEIGLYSSSRDGYLLPKFELAGEGEFVIEKIDVKTSLCEG